MAINLSFIRNLCYSYNSQGFLKFFSKYSVTLKHSFYLDVKKTLTTNPVRKALVMYLNTTFFLSCNRFLSKIPKYLANLKLQDLIFDYLIVLNRASNIHRTIKS